MCGRIHVRNRKPEMLDEFRELHIQPDLKFLERFNVTPSQDVPVVRQEPDGTLALLPMSWGLIPSWAPESGARAESIARAETVASKRTFKDSFVHRRCIIPVAGYYEWQRITPHVKQPWYMYRPDGGIMSLAGLWSTWKSDDGESHETCCIITISPNEQLAEIHDRMPVVLARDTYDAWLNAKIIDPSTVQPLLQACPENWLSADPVSAYVNSPQHEGPKCIEPVKLQRGLFD